MSSHPVNLLLRFLLEIAALAGLAAWGWGCTDGTRRVIVAIAFAGIPAIVWGVFRIRNDGGPPMIEVTGRVRLLIEAVFFFDGLLRLVVFGWAHTGDYPGCGLPAALSARLRPRFEDASVER